MHWKMNTYCPLIKFTFAKKLTDRDLPKRTTYSSPTLKFLFKKLTYFIQPKQDQFWLSSPMGWVPLPRSFPISWYCKLDTGMQEPNLHPELQNWTNCCKWTCCSDLPIRQTLYQPGMVLLPRWTTVPKDSPNQPPTRIYKTAAKEINRPRSQDNTPGG